MTCTECGHTSAQPIYAPYRICECDCHDLTLPFGEGPSVETVEVVRGL